MWKFLNFDISWAWQNAASCAEVWMTLVIHRDMFPSEFLEQVAVVWWLLRKTRNGYIFWQKRTSVEVIATLASSILQEFWVHWPSFNAKLTQHNSKTSGNIRWLLPKYGHFKINVNAAVGGDQTGIGVLARDSQGIITRAMAQYLSRCHSALTMEVQAVIQGLCLARKCNLSPMENRN